MVKYTVSGRDYFVYLYDNNFFIGRRKVYFHRGKYFLKYKGVYREILDFIVRDIPLASVDVNYLV